MQLPDHSQSVWDATSPRTSYPPLAGDADVDVAIVGAGLSGLAAAAMLSEAGRSVAIVDQARIALGETGYTTAHLTEEVDGRYSRIARDFGRDAARLVARSSREAIAWIEETTASHAIDCGFERLPGYLYSERQADLAGIREEMTAASDAGVAAAWAAEVPLPFSTAGGMRVDNQAQFHPRAFLLPLARRLADSGVRIYEETRAVAVEDGEPCRVETEHGTLRARDVLVLANVPVINRVALITKIASYRTYAIGVRGEHGVPRALFWDTDDPYHYTRTHPANDGPILIVGGEDHKTGTEPDTRACFDHLADYARARFGIDRVAYRWSGQIVEPVDGLPYIGLNTASSHVYVGTGYSGNGMTFSIVAARLLSDLVCGRATPYAELYDATRVTPMASAKEYIAENVDFPKYFARDRLTSADAERRDPSSVAPGDGRILVIGGEKYAVHRDRGGQLHTLSPVCPHMGCDVSWNPAEESWDCPCHGSRFSATGDVLNGPAVARLKEARPGGSDRS